MPSKPSACCMESSLLEAPKLTLLRLQVEWGGGASVENPHRQRVLYCELLVQDLLQRLPASRFPSVEEDLKVSLGGWAGQGAG